MPTFNLIGYPVASGNILGAILVDGATFAISQNQEFTLTSTDGTLSTGDLLNGTGFLPDEPISSIIFTNITLGGDTFPVAILQVNNSAVDMIIRLDVGGGALSTEALPISSGYDVGAAITDDGFTLLDTVGAGNTDPDAVDDSATTDEDNSVLIDVLGNDTDGDGDSLTIDSVGTPSNGSATIEGGQVRYTPDANFFGSDSFTYTISDGNGGSDTATVSVTINEVNDSPDAMDDSATTNEDTSVLIDVLGNDSDVDGDSLTIQSVATPVNGSATIESGQVRYTPNADFNGSDSFIYTIADGQGGFDLATVTITVNEVNDDPDAVNDSASVDEDDTVLVDVLGNDSDVDGDSLTITSVSAPASGSATIESGQVRYTPDADFNGSDSFTYTISDGRGGSDTATVSVTVNEVNDDPDAVDDSVNTNEDTSVLIDVLGNDTDVDGDSLTITSVGTPTNGSATIESGQVRYTPDANFFGSDSFTYTISDGRGGSDTATVSVNVSDNNFTPDAVDDSASTDEDNSVLIDVLGNDTDGDGDSLTITSVGTPANGSATIESGQVRYTPDADFSGSDSFTYTIADGRGGSDNATVSVTINEVNDDPVANDDSATTDEDNSVLIDVLGNDTDVDGDSLTVTSVGTAANGSATIESGQVRYTPDANFFGSDSFTYTISDGRGGSDTATVSVTINEVNDDPDAVDDSASTDEDNSVLIDVLGNDTDVDADTLTISSVGTPANGSATIESGQVRYTPDANFFGSDSFTYTISDGRGGSDTATVSVTINEVNDDPDAVDDSASTDEDNSVLIDVLGNDTDVDGDSLTISSVGTPASGSATIESGQVRYTPGANFFGSDSFTYTISDGRGGSDTATVSVTVNEVNDDPDAVDDSASTDEDTAVLIDVLGNDTDVDGDSLTVTSVGTPANGSATIESGQVRYTPDANFFGSDSFTYTISDGRGGSDTATVSVTVNEVNDDPDAVDDSATTDEDNSVLIDVLGNDTDVDGDSLTVTSVGTAANGSATIESGQVRYTPDANFFGSDSFTYTISDGRGGSDTATVSVTVNEVNDDPVANDDSATTGAGASVLIDVLANDTDVDGDSLTITAVGTPTNGSATIESGQVRFTPDQNFAGSDSFTYTISDGRGGTATGTVNIVENLPPSAPTIDGDQSVDEEAANGTVVGALSSTDEDPVENLIFTLDDAAGGRFALSGRNLVVADGTLLEFEANTSHSVTVTVTDTGGLSAQQTFQIDVNDIIEVFNGQTGFDDGRSRIGDNIFNGTAGDDFIAPSTGVDQINLGTGGDDTVSGSLDDLLGDTVSGFGEGDTIVFTGVSLARDEVSIQTGSAIVSVSPGGTPAEGPDGTALTLTGDFSGGGFLTARDSSDTDLGFVNFLPTLTELQSVDDALINGVGFTPFLTSDGQSTYTFTFESATSAFENAMGVFELTSEGIAKNLRFLVENSLQTEQGMSVTLETPDAGDRFVFFLVQNGSPLDALPTDFPDLATLFDFRGDPTPVADILSDLEDAGLTVFFSEDSLNPGGVRQVLSGASADSQELTFGFEDLLNGQGDNDFQDIIFSFGQSEVLV